MSMTGQKLTLIDVLNDVRNKLDEAQDFLEEMQKTKYDRVRFSHRLSAFLAASGSVTMIMERRGKKYTRQINEAKVDAFERWYDSQCNFFRTPKKAKAKSKGTNDEWVYLEAARNETIHIQPISLKDLIRLSSFDQLYARDSGSLVTHNADGSVEEEVIVQEEPLPLEAFEAQSKTEVEGGLYLFKPLTIEVHGKEYVLNPPSDGVVTVCKKHITTLTNLVENFKKQLEL